MSLPVFIAPELEAPTATPTAEHRTVPAATRTAFPDDANLFELTGSEARHAATVMRLGIGDDLRLTNGHLASDWGAAARARVVSVDAKDRLTVEILDWEMRQDPSPRVTVVQAIPKSERAELTVDLLTQGGVDDIVPWHAHRCIAKWAPNKAAKQRAKWENAARAATKQSRRLSIPAIDDVNDTRSVCALIEQSVRDGALALVLHESARESIAALDDSAWEAPHVLLIVGPEGGITDEELERFTHAGAQPVLLGSEVLRTATAGFVGLCAIGVKSGRWSEAVASPR